MKEEKIFLKKMSLLFALLKNPPFLLCWERRECEKACRRRRRRIMLSQSTTTSNNNNNHSLLLFKKKKKKKKLIISSSSSCSSSSSIRGGGGGGRGRCVPMWTSTPGKRTWFMRKTFQARDGTTTTTTHASSSSRREEEEKEEKTDDDAHPLLANEQRRVRPDRIVGPLGDIEIENDVGVSQPFGVSLVGRKTLNFSVRAPNAEKVKLVLYFDKDEKKNDSLTEPTIQIDMNETLENGGDG